MSHNVPVEARLPLCPWCYPTENIPNARVPSQWGNCLQFTTVCSWLLKQSLNLSFSAFPIQTTISAKWFSFSAAFPDKCLSLGWFETMLQQLFLCRWSSETEINQNRRITFSELLERWTFPPPLKHSHDPLGVLLSFLTCSSYGRRVKVNLHMLQISYLLWK